jgi:hypothetical protein
MSDERVLYGFVSAIAAKLMPQFPGSSPGAVIREHPYLRLLLSAGNGAV